ncbi:DUF6640 family protein [Nocardia sp. NPDC004415]
MTSAPTCAANWRVPRRCCTIPASAEQHLRNDAWPPHAKFHDAQYIVMSILLIVLTAATVLTYRPAPAGTQV